MFYIGAAYYPELWSKSEIDKDIKLMKEYGMNCMRIGEFAWSNMEPSEGLYTFDFLKYTVDKLYENAGVTDTLRSQQKEDKYVILLASLYKVVNALTTEPVYNYDKTEKFDESYKIENYYAIEKKNDSYYNKYKVSKSPDEVIAVNDFSFEIPDGKLIGLLGPSGCGKSTLLNILGLLDNPTGGSYRLLDKEVGNLKEKERTQFRKGNLGFVFQSFNLIDEMTVFENVELPLVYMGIKASERKKRVEEILDRMNISHRAGHFPQQLSGGQQQRVAIARAVVSNPKLVLADEPTGNLDSKNGQEVMSLLQELNREGTTIIMVTHSQHDAQFASRTICLFDGQIVTDVANKL